MKYHVLACIIIYTCYTQEMFNQNLILNNYLHLIERVKISLAIAKKIPLVFL